MTKLEPQDPSKPLRNFRQEQVILNILKGMSNTQAYNAVYKCKNDQTASAIVTRMLGNASVSARLEWLQKQAADVAIADVRERKIILSAFIREIGNHNPSD